MPIPAHDVRRAILPLRLIFWGGLLCLFDLTFSQTVNGEGWKFDVLNDAVGAILIAIGVFQLGAIRVHDGYAKAMLFVRILAALNILAALHDHLIYRIPAGLSFALIVFQLATLAAIVIFCLCMRWFSLEAGLGRSAASWKLTAILFVVVYVFPLGLFYVAVLVAIATGESFNINLGPFFIPVLFIFFVPLIHFFISTSRMKRESEAAGGI